MTERGSSLCFSGNFCVTYGAVYYAIVGAAVYTVSCYCVFNDCLSCGVTKRRYKLLTAYGTGLRLSTGCSCACGVAGCVGDLCFSGNLCAAYGAVNYAVVRACGLTACRC